MHCLPSEDDLSHLTTTLLRDLIDIARLDLVCWTISRKIKSRSKIFLLDKYYFKSTKEIFLTPQIILVLSRSVKS